MRENGLSGCYVADYIYSLHSYSTPRWSYLPRHSSLIANNNYTERGNIITLETFKEMIASNYYSANSKTLLLHTVLHKTGLLPLSSWDICKLLRHLHDVFFYIFIDIKTRGKYSFGVSEANLIVIHVRVVKNTRKRRCKIWNQREQQQVLI